MSLSKSLVSITLQTLIYVTLASSTLTETLLAQGLIGSHFGVPGVNASFDYVIAGGGTAGLTLAKRLAENGSVSVAVIEAGDFYEFSNGNFSEVPAYAAQFVGSNPILKNPLLDWYQYTERQTGLGDRIMLYPTGKVLGGSSARNFMWYHRSSCGSYQKWADMTGDDSYEFKNFVTYFRKSAQFHPPNQKTRLPNATTLYNQSAFSPDGGPLQVGYPAWVNPISSWIGLGLSALGLKELSGMTDGNIFGWTYTAFTKDPRSQTRSSSETSYLRAALAEGANLLVYKNTMAKKITFDGNKQASAVVVETAGITYQIKAAKEVIVSSGAFRSPQLLMVSGIGPGATLAALQIPILSDLQGVGQNMWDHIAFSPAYAVDLTTHSQLSSPAFAEEQRLAYNTNRTGILTNCGGDILGFDRLPDGAVSDSIREQLDSFASDWPDYEHLFLDAYFGYANDSSGAPTDGRSYVSSSTALTNPFSRGNVTINSTDTNDRPLVSPNWLLDRRDQEVAVAAFKRARAVFTNNATRPIVLGDEAFPGLNVSSNAEILDLIQRSAAASYHASATCAMGKAEDPMAVLDSKARVYGVRGLRVVDASAFPVLPPGHPSSTIYALAEKIADDILHGD